MVATSELGTMVEKGRKIRNLGYPRPIVDCIRDYYGATNRIGIKTTDEPRPEIAVTKPKKRPQTRSEIVMGWIRSYAVFKAANSPYLPSLCNDPSVIIQ